jgi:glutamine synthetase
MSGQVQNHFFEFDRSGTPVWDFKGKNILKGVYSYIYNYFSLVVKYNMNQILHALKKGETDGSSYPNGGLRATHAAGGYLSVDPTSPIFLRGDTIFIPACLVSYFGHALDEKTPLLRSCDALSKQGARLLNLLGYKVKGLVTNIGMIILTFPLYSNF